MQQSIIQYIHTQTQNNINITIKTSKKNIIQHLKIYITCRNVLTAQYFLRNRTKTIDLAFYLRITKKKQLLFTHLNPPIPYAHNQQLIKIHIPIHTIFIYKTHIQSRYKNLKTMNHTVHIANIYQIYHQSLANNCPQPSTITTPHPPTISTPTANNNKKHDTKYNIEKKTHTHREKRK